MAKAIPFFLLLLTTLTTSAPLQKTAAASQGTLAASQISQIDATSASCASATYPDECTSASDAMPFINAGFAKYNVIHPGTKAALLATMLYESGGFQYNKNHYPAPGTPGQGTKNMQSPAYNTKYATALYPDKVAAASAQGPAAVLELVSGNADSFASAAWFMATQCDQSVRPALASGSQAGWEQYLGCIGTTVTDDRTAVWTKAKAALGVQ